MKIVADESVDKQIVDRLRFDGHDVLSIAELDPGIDDDVVLLKSRESGAARLTADKDFGELVFRQGLLHSGIVLIRLAGLQAMTNRKWKIDQEEGGTTTSSLGLNWIKTQKEKCSNGSTSSGSEGRSVPSCISRDSRRFFRSAASGFA